MPDFVLLFRQLVAWLLALRALLPQSPLATGRRMRAALDTLFADVSSFQRAVDNSYPYRFLSIRSNDGTYRDFRFAVNLAWCKLACKSGRLDGFLVYMVFETNWQDTFATFKSMVGTPHPKMAVMIDVESWPVNGVPRIRGDHSAQINALREAVIDWLGGGARARKRVIAYGNAGDLNSLYPSRSDAKIVLANYSANPSFPGKIAHQFSSSFNVPPFGRCDINSADGYTPEQFAIALGLLSATPVPDPKPIPDPTPVPIPDPTPVPIPAPVIISTEETDMPLILIVDKASVPQGKKWPGDALLSGSICAHIASAADFSSLKAAGCPVSTISYATWLNISSKG